MADAIVDSAPLPRKDPTASDASVKSIVVLESPEPPERAPVPVPTPQPCFTWISKGHIPSLDGLRAFSIGLVLFAHVAETPGFPIDGKAFGVSKLGSIGVDMFFVISGFLITLLLIREREKTGDTSLVKFYVRRFFRIMPAYFTFLAFIFLLQCLDTVSMRGRDWAAVLTYTINFMPNGDWPTAPVGHTWSLAVEEHFYMLWPLAFAILGPRRVFWPALALILASPFIRYAVDQSAIGILEVDYSTPTRIDVILFGCCLAILAQKEWFRSRSLPIVRHANWLLPALTILVLLSNLVLARSGKYYLTVNKLVTGLTFASIIWLSTVRADSLWGQVLNWRPIVWMGTLSYSLYLWQQPFLFHHSDWFVNTWPANIVCALGLALASFYLVESPLLRLRERKGWGKV